MKTKSAGIALAVVMLCGLATVAIHWSTIGKYLPRECGHCHLPTVIPADATGMVKPDVKDLGGFYRCVRCGEHWWELTIKTGEASPPCWMALYNEVVGITDNGPVHAGQELPKDE